MDLEYHVLKLLLPRNLTQVTNDTVNSSGLPFRSVPISIAVIWLTSALISFLPISLDWHSAGGEGGGSPIGVSIGGKVMYWKICNFFGKMSAWHRGIR